MKLTKFALEFQTELLLTRAKPVNSIQIIWIFDEWYSVKSIHKFLNQLTSVPAIWEHWRV